jgi:hypothetical protein
VSQDLADANAALLLGRAIGRLAARPLRGNSLRAERSSRPADFLLSRPISLEKTAIAPFFSSASALVRNWERGMFCAAAALIGTAVRISIRVYLRTDSLPRSMFFGRESRSFDEPWITKRRRAS